MRKRMKLLGLALMALTVLPLTAVAQEMPQIPQLPIDEGVRIGKLSNGLTYYIRHNEKPKGQADFYIAQKVGSMQEEDNQRGLAHFLEHMCFNGTTNFPGNSMIEWLETVGVKFGSNLNAYTFFDETVYNISNVPTARETVQDSCLLVLHDWANELTLDPTEIDKERGVIHEEWRMRNVGSMRIMTEMMPKLFPGSKYGERLPIGTMEIIDNFPPQALRDYYEKWYNPENQGIIVVGDIDVDRIEAKIKEMFSDIPKAKHGGKKELYPVPDHKGTIYAIGKDPEMSNNIVELSWKSDVLPAELTNTQFYYVNDFMNDIITMMLNNRFQDMLTSPDTPFAAAYTQAGPMEGFAYTKDSFGVTGISKGSDVKPVLEAVYREIRRAAENGFTQTEYDRAKEEYMSRIETIYNNRDSRENEDFVNEYKEHFLKGHPIPGIDLEYLMYQQLVPMLPVEAVNQAMAEMITPDNRIVVAMLADKPETVIPTEQDLEAIMNAVDAEAIEAFVDNVKTEPLVPSLPAPGSIVAETKNAQWDATEWTLSNGAKVIVKPTKFKEDQILVAAFALGGTAELSDKYNNSLALGSYAFSNNGLGTYNNNDLSKYLKGKQVGLSPDFSDYSREIQGFSTPKDLPTLMELIYMTFTDLNYDATEFAAMQSQLAGVLQHQESTPNYIFSKRLMEKLFKSPRRAQIEVSKIKDAKVEDIQEIAKAMTQNIADYTFVFVGNVDLKTLRPLVEQYIASVPGMPAMAIKSVPEFNPDLFVTPGTFTDISTTKMETPQTFVAVVASADMPYDSKTQKLASIAGQIMTNRLLKTVREDWGSVYSISASGMLSRQGPSNVLVQSAFPMKSEDRDKVLDFIAGQFVAMENDVTPEELAPVKEYMEKNIVEAREKNEGWFNGILGSLINGVDTFNGAQDVIKSITVDDVKAFMKELNKQHNYHVIVLDPEQ